MATAYLGLGSNLGDRENNLEEALRVLSSLRNTRLLRRAAVYETRPVGGPEGQGLFLNTACAVETTLTPHEFLDEIHAIERAIGRLRERETERWGPRLIDIDILFWDDLVLTGERLTIPHPRVAERLFALLPLTELAPELRHPTLNRTIRELLGEFKKHEGIRRLPL